MASTAISRDNIPGWGADLDPKNRPASRREANSESVADARRDQEYELVERQVPKVEILVSTEHKKLPPIFGTSCPPKGLSGVFRRLAFRFSEGQKAHWLILILADRIDVYESALGDLLRGRPDNPFAEMGLKTEFRRGGFFSRFGQNRADVRRWRQQFVLVAGLGAASYLTWKAISRD